VVPAVTPGIKNKTNSVTKSDPFHQKEKGAQVISRGISIAKKPFFRKLLTSGEVTRRPKERREKAAHGKREEPRS